jgi:site-specific recombinase XerD
MSELRDAFIQSITPIRAAKTVEAYSTASRKFEEFLEAWGKTLATAPKQSLASFAIYLSRSGLAPASVHLYVNGATQYVNWLRDNGADIPRMTKPKMPRIKEHIPIVLKEQALATYVEVAKTVRDPYGTALGLLPMTGLRISEMCQLRMVDLEIQAPWVRFLVRGKSKADRKVPMLKQGKALLARYLKYSRPELPGDHWLFPNRNGDHISTRSTGEEMRKVRVRLGLKHLTPHVLRHTYLTILNENGITGFDLAEIAGHKNLNTSRIYVHPSATELSKKVEAIDLPHLEGRKPKGPKVK